MNKEFLYMQKLAGIITESEYKAMLNENESGPIEKILFILSEKIDELGIENTMNKDVNGIPYINFEKDGESYKLHINDNGDIVISYWDVSSGEGEEIFSDETYNKNWDLDLKNYEELDFSKTMDKIKSL